MIAPNSNQSIFEVLKKNNSIIEKIVPGNLMKAVKNETEQEGFRTVMVRDGVAMVKFLHWLTHSVGKEELDEYSIGEKLLDFRSEGENFIGNSFGSIVGFKDNGAIMHYSAKSDGSSKVINDGSVHLDALARMPLWKEGKDYNHGTGHGVGSFLNVHEGPQSIRKELNPVELDAGMVLSNEPGYYLEGKYGIRHENLILIKTWKETEWNTFYEFETLTLCPFFKSIMVKEMLSQEEIEWINAYHNLVNEKLGPLLEGEVKEWFKYLVSPL